jgi:hypothetical protein
VPLQASYRTTIYVANATLDTPKIATLAANLTITGQVGLSQGMSEMLQPEPVHVYVSGVGRLIKAVMLESML